MYLYMLLRQTAPPWITEPPANKAVDSLDRASPLPHTRKFAPVQECFAHEKHLPPRTL